MRSLWSWAAPCRLSRRLAYSAGHAASSAHADQSLKTDDVRGRRAPAAHHLLMSASGVPAAVKRTLRRSGAAGVPHARTAPHFPTSVETGHRNGLRLGPERA